MENEEKEVVKEKKKGKGKTIAIILLVLLVVGMGSYIAYDKYFSKQINNPKEEKKEKKEEKNKIEEIDINSDEVKKLVERYKLEESGMFGTGKYIFNLGIEKKADVNSISLEDAVSLTTSVVEERKIQVDQACPDGFSKDCMIITNDTYDEAFHYAFGPDVSVIQNTKEDLAYCHQFTYDSTKNNYYTAARCGGTGYPELASFVVAASKSTDENYITINMKPYYIYTDTDIIENLSGSNAISISPTVDIIKTNYIEYVDTYQLIFKKASDNNYYFYSVENLKDAKEYKDNTQQK